MEETNSDEKKYEFLNCAEFIQLDDYYSKPNYLRIINKHRSETAHSSFIAWLLNPKESHNLGIYPLQLIFELYKDPANPNTNSAEFDNFHNVSVETEYSFKSKKNLRIDVFVSGKLNNKDFTSTEDFTLTIENKINSSEHGTQTDDYFKMINKNNNNGCKNFFIYLKPYTLVLDEKISSNEYIFISYQMFYENVLIPIIEKLHVKQDAKNINYLNEYIESFAISIEDRGYLLVTNFEKEKYDSIIKMYENQINDAIGDFDAFLIFNQSYLIPGEGYSSQYIRFINLLKYLRYYSLMEEQTEKIKEILDSTKDFTKYEMKLLDSGESGKEIKKVRNIAKSAILTELFDIIDYTKWTIEDFKSIFPEYIGVKNNIQFYHLYSSKDDFIKARKEFGKDNKFYNYKEPIIIKEHYIVMKKAWTTRLNTNYEEGSGINFLVKFINDKSDIFKVEVSPYE